MAHSDPNSLDQNTENKFYVRAILKIKLNHKANNNDDKNFTCLKLNKKFNSKEELYEFAFY